MKTKSSKATSRIDMRRVTFTEWVRFFYRRQLAVAALSPPAFSPSQRTALVALASVHERQWREG